MTPSGASTAVTGAPGVVLLVRARPPGFLIPAYCALLCLVDIRERAALNRALMAG